MRCRCGHDTESNAPHPCHRCVNVRALEDAAHEVQPGTRRFVCQSSPHSLAGMQRKIAAYETWACDACWGVFRAERKAAQP